MKHASNPKFLFANFYFFYFAATGVWIIFVPKLLYDYGYTTAQIGVALSLTSLVRFASPFLFIRHVRLDTRLFNLNLMAFLLFTILLYFSIASFWLFTLNLLFFGFSYSLILPYLESISIKEIGKERYGRIRLWGSIGFMLIALFFAQLYDNKTLFFWYIAITILSVLLAYIIAKKYSYEEPVSHEDIERFSITKHLYLWISIFLVQVGFGAYYNFFTIYETEHNLSIAQTSYLWAIGVSAEIVMLYFQGSLLKRFDLLSLMKLSVLLTAFRWMMTYLWGDVYGLMALAQSIHAFSFALYHTVVVVYLYELYTQKKLSQQMFLGIGYGLGGFVGSLVSGWVYGEWLFAFSAGVSLVAFLALTKSQKIKVKS